MESLFGSGIKRRKKSESTSMARENKEILSARS